jgi:hypothetical protein
MIYVVISRRVSSVAMGNARAAQPGQMSSEPVSRIAGLIVIIGAASKREL